MFLRYLLFIAIIIVFIIFIMVLVKDTGDSRKKIEKRIKLKPDEIETKKSAPAPAPALAPTLKVAAKDTKTTKFRK